MSESTPVDWAAEIRKDPAIQAALDALGPILPVLERMGEDAWDVLRSLATGKDEYEAMRDLRAEATDTEWTAICATLIDGGKKANIKALDNARILWSVTAKVLLSLALGLP